MWKPTISQCMWYICMFAGDVELIDLQCQKLSQWPSPVWMSILWIFPFLHTNDCIKEVAMYRGFLVKFILVVWLLVNLFIPAWQLASRQLILFIEFQHCDYEWCSIASQPVRLLLRQGLWCLLLQFTLSFCQGAVSTLAHWFWFDTHSGRDFNSTGGLGRGKNSFKLVQGIMHLVMQPLITKHECLGQCRLLSQSGIGDNVDKECFILSSGSH